MFIFYLVTYLRGKKCFYDKCGGLWKSEDVKEDFWKTIGDINEKIGTMDMIKKKVIAQKTCKGQHEC